MVTKCANPRCDHRFMYSGEGKLFFLDRRARRPAIENLFWLCGQCVTAYTIVLDDQATPNIVPRAAIRAEKPGGVAL